MRQLFELDRKDYIEDGTRRVRPSVRTIIIRDGKVAMLHVLRYDYYKFPGGGIEPGETHEQTAIRETREEAGLVVIPGTVREYGNVHRLEKDSKWADVLDQDNYYYFCEIEPEILPQALEEKEAYDQLTLEFVDPREAIKVNRSLDHGKKSPLSVERATRVLEILLEEGYFG